MLRVASSCDDFVRIFKYAARLKIDENSHKDSTWKPHKISTRPPTIKNKIKLSFQQTFESRWW